MGKWLVKWMDRIFVVAGALVFLQAPLFIQQYQQQLSGHVDELRMQVDAMRMSATHSDKTLDQYIEKFTQSSDGDFSRQGELMSGMVKRLDDLSFGMAKLNEANPWSRPFLFMWYSKQDIVQTTIHSFSLGIPLTFEGLVFALVGMIIGCLLFAGIKKLCRKLAPRKKPAPIPETPSLTKR